MGALAVRLTVSGKPVTIVTTHFSTAYPEDRDRRNLAALAEHTQEAAALRANEARELLTFVGQQERTVLVAGDFNTPPRGLLYRELARALKDSFAATGLGTGYTFRSDRPCYRIDYLWAGPAMTPVACRALPLQVSDHRPVVGEFIVGGKR